ncbi:MAG: SH3 domain-containing protein, partial [Oscillospiraceae bacterium]
DNVITEIPLGEVVGYIESASSVFAKVDYHGTIGYSKHEYLSANPPVYQKKQSPSAQNITYLQVQNVKTSIYLRSSPSSNGGIIMEIPVGEYVEFLENANGTFYKIRYNGTVGYSKSEYLG